MRHQVCCVRGVAALLCAFVCVGVHAQPLAVDGNLEVRYDDQLIDLYVNGTDLTTDTVQINAGWHVGAQFSETVPNGVLVVAATVYNGGYTGGLMVNINTDQGSTVSDTTWKWMIDPPSGWEQPNFNDNSWYPVYDQGGADSVPTMVRDSACILRTDSCPLNPFIATGARFLWADEDVYFRRTFTYDSACSVSVWAGCRGPHVIYYDGVEVTRCDSADSSVEGRFYLDSGSHTIAISAQTTVPLINGSGGAMRMGLANKYPDTLISPILDWFSEPPYDTIGWDTQYVTVYRPLLYCDTLWKVTHEYTAGWEQPSFNDASWWDADLVSDQIFPADYPGLSNFPLAAKTIWLPRTISFRGTISLNDLGVAPGASEALSRATRVRHGAGILTVSVPGLERHMVAVYGLNGNVVYRGTTAGGEHRIDCSRWARGQYLLRVRNAAATITRSVLLTD